MKKFAAVVLGVVLAVMCSESAFGVVIGHKENANKSATRISNDISSDNTTTNNETNSTPSTTPTTNTSPTTTEPAVPEQESQAAPTTEPETPETPPTTSSRWTTSFTITPSMQTAVTSAFPGLNPADIHTFEGIITADTWTPDSRDINTLTNMGERVAFTLPVTAAREDGVYILLCTLSDDIMPGTFMRLHNIAGEVGSSAVSESEYMFFDENYSQITAVPENRQVYIAVRMTAGQTNMGVITVYEGNADAVITPITLSPDIIEDIAQSLNVSPDALRPIAPENITEAKDPTPEITDLAKEEGYEIIGKISTIKVDEPGYYYFQVTISDDKLWEQIASQDVDIFRFYAMEAEEAVRSSFFMGAMNVLELRTLSGHKISKFGAREFIMTLFLNTSQPLSLFIAKAIFALLTGGLGAACNIGISSVVLGLLIVKLILRK